MRYPHRTNDSETHNNSVCVCVCVYDLDRPRGARVFLHRHHERQRRQHVNVSTVIDCYPPPFVSGHGDASRAFKVLYLHFLSHLLLITPFGERYGVQFHRRNERKTL
jgi:hypothetical protein